MRQIDEFSEAHLVDDQPPFAWIFRTREYIRVTFGVKLSALPAKGRVLLRRWNEPRQNIAVFDFVRSYDTDSHRIFEVTLGQLPRGSYIYNVCYTNERDIDRVSGFQRYFAVDDYVPRRIEDVGCQLLISPDGSAVYGSTPVPKHLRFEFDMSGRLIYSLIVDRFSRETSGYQVTHWEDILVPESPLGRHGGTLKGVMNRLDYLAELGVGVILLNPLYPNEDFLYHGYHPIHLFMVDPVIGSIDDVRELVEAAHARDIAVVLDVVCNHVGDVINWSSGETADFKYFCNINDLQVDARGHRLSRPFSSDVILPYPIEARHVGLFHGNRYSDPIRCRLFGILDDWRTELPEVQRLLIAHLKFWIGETNIDGLRYDAVRHVEPAFWDLCNSEIRRYANAIGKRSFSLIAEHAGTTDEEWSPWASVGFSHLLDFPSNSRLRKEIRASRGVDALVRYLTDSDLSGRREAADIQRIFFLDNHDQTRILYDLAGCYHDEQIAIRALHLALAALILGPSVPSLYYGTEQEFAGAIGLFYNAAVNSMVGHDHYVREDMFANPECSWLYGQINRARYDEFSIGHPTFRWTATLAKLRREYSDIFATIDREFVRCPQPELSSCMISSIDGARHLYVLANREQQLVKAVLSVPMPRGNLHRNTTVKLLADGCKGTIINGELLVKLEPFGICVVALE